MKSLKLALALLTLAAALGAPQAKACSYFINEIAKKNDIVAAAATHLNLELSIVSKNGVDGFRWWESKPTPMCPAEMTYEGVVTLEYQDPTATFPRDCVSTFKVTKVEDWKTHLVDFNFENEQTTCKN